jgi:hypothetical protein
MTVIDLTPAASSAAAPVGTAAGGQEVNDAGQPSPAFYWIGPWSGASAVLYAAGGSSGGQGTLPPSAAYASLPPGAGDGTTSALHRGLRGIVMRLPAAHGARPFDAAGQDPLGNLGLFFTG